MNSASSITALAEARMRLTALSALHHMTHGDRYRSFLDGIARLGAVAAVLVGSAVTLGWLLDVNFLKSVLPGFASVKVNTAFGFLAAGVALWLTHTAEPGSQSLQAARALSAFVAAVGGLTLAEDLFTIDLGIDQLVMTGTPTRVNPGRMAPVTSLNFLLVGLALLSLKARRSHLAAFAHWLVVPPLFLSTLAVVGYAYGVTSFYQVRPFTPMALPSALSFFALTLAIMAADPTRGIVAITGSSTAGGVLARRLISTIPITLFAFGWASLAGERAGWYDPRFGLALMVVLGMTASVLAVASTALTLHKLDVNRKHAEAEVTTLNAGLERRVEERTHELAQRSMDLAMANESLEKLSLHDGLTNLANRRFFDRYLANQISAARRHDRKLGLVLLDVDAFKAYNDRYGHPAGDECLKQVAAALKSCCRRPFDMAARYGGEEFALILPDTDMAGAMQIAEAARNAVAELRIPHEASPAAPHVSISGGVAVLIRETNATAVLLIAAADRRLFQAKHLGRNRIVSPQAEAA